MSVLAYLPLLPPLVCVCFSCKFCHKLLVHPCSSLGGFAWFPAHWAGGFLSLEEVTLQNQQILLHLPSLQSHIYGFLWSRTLDRLQSALFPWPWLWLKAWFCDFPALRVSSINTSAYICGELAKLSALIWTGEFCIWNSYLEWTRPAKSGQVLNVFAEGYAFFWHVLNFCLLIHLFLMCVGAGTHASSLSGSDSCTLIYLRKTSA